MTEKIRRWFGYIQDGSFMERLKMGIAHKWSLYGVQLAHGREARELSRQYKVYQKLLSYRNVAENVFVDSSIEKREDKIIWSMWLQGEENAPDLAKVCFASHNKLKDYQTIVLTEKTIGNYVTLPDYIWEKYRKGCISRTHLSDIVRVAILCKYGGIWCDAMCYYSGNGELPEYMKESELFVYSKKLGGAEATNISSWFMKASNNNVIIHAVREMLYVWWRDNNKLPNYFLLHIFFKIATEVYQDEWKKVPHVNNATPHTLQFEMNETFDEKRWKYISEASVFHKLTYVQEIRKGSFLEYIMKMELEN